jgi:two-component system sensor histidine kinase KdpD
MGFASTLHDQEDRFEPEERRGLLLRILSNTRRLSEFVENLLQFARIESGELQVERLPLDLEALIRRTVAEFEASDPTRPFDVEVDPGLPTVVGDEPRQWQILMNLLSNAVKYSPPGAPVSVHVRSGDEFVEVSVCDAGDGIPAAELPRLFSKFSRIGPADGAKKAMGTGLGLYISRSLVEAQGGEIDVTSSLGVGTTFTYTVPVL